MTATSVWQFAVVGGGARSGKSAFALGLAQQLGKRRVFLATAEGLDDEMRARIDRHRRERGDAFTTLEVPLAVPEALDRIDQADVVLIDCLTFWLSNMLVRGDDAAIVLRRIEELSAAITRRRYHLILVSNEVGMGLVPETPLGRTFRDVVGQAHRRLCPAADQTYVALMGQILRLGPGPVQLCRDLGGQ